MTLSQYWLLLWLTRTALPNCQDGGAGQWTRCPIFCGLTGQVPHSNCTIFQLDAFNRRIRPIVQRVLERPYFRFYKTRLHPHCSFWPAPDQCFGQGCAVRTCSSTELPDRLKRSWDEVDFRYTHSECEENDPLGRLDMSKGVCDEKNGHGTDKRKRHEEAMPFCELPDDENQEESVIVDLQRNPERYTGYRGESSWRVWRAIYGENCFWPNPYAGCERERSRSSVERETCSKSGEHATSQLCFENQVFYNIISGFHASVNVHVCAQFFFPGQVLAGHWGYNLPEFTRRFGAMQTNGEGTRYLKNLYFLYLLELRALIKAEPMLRQLSYDDESCSEVLASAAGSCAVSDCGRTGSCHSKGQKASTYNLVVELLDSLSELKCAFDESQMFRVDRFADGLDECASDAVKEMFRTKFVNITRILDCVSCDKCRMWGRLQIKAVGTALNILFHDRSHREAPLVGDSMPRLSRAQLVALLNGFGRCSESLSHIAHFRKMSNEYFHTEL